MERKLDYSVIREGTDIAYVATLPREEILKDCIEIDDIGAFLASLPANG